MKSFTGKDGQLWINYEQFDTYGIYPSSIYSWSIGHILKHKFFCLGRLGRLSRLGRLGSQGSKGKSGFEEFRATFEGGCFNFLRSFFF